MRRRRWKQSNDCRGSGLSGEWLQLPAYSTSGGRTREFVLIGDMGCLSTADCGVCYYAVRFLCLAIMFPVF
jgi:hypothetical protein